MIEASIQLAPRGTGIALPEGQPLHRVARPARWEVHPGDILIWTGGDLWMEPKPGQAKAPS
jgi:hypothetical protein